MANELGVRDVRAHRRATIVATSRKDNIVAAQDVHAALQIALIVEHRRARSSVRRMSRLQDARYLAGAGLALVAAFASYCRAATAAFRSPRPRLLGDWDPCYGRAQILSRWRSRCLTQLGPTLLGPTSADAQRTQGTVII